MIAIDEPTQVRTNVRTSLPMMFQRYACCVFALGCFVSPAFAQPPIPSIRLEAGAAISPSSARVGSNPLEDAGSASAAAAAEPAKPPTRLEAFGKITLDRRPSRVLDAWSASKSVSAPTAEPPLEVPPGPFEFEVQRVQTQVLAGEWGELAAYLAELDDGDEAAAVYRLLLSKLSSAPPDSPAAHPAGRAFQETNSLTTGDIFELLLASPGPHDPESIKSLGLLLAKSINSGNTINKLLTELDAELKKPADVPVITRRQTAQLLEAAGQSVHLAGFLPSLKTATESDDAEALNLLGSLYLAKYGESQEQDDLEQAWQLLQHVLASESADDESQQLALTQAVSLSSMVRKELGQEWLDSSFADNSERGLRILSTVGKLTSRGLMSNPTNPQARAKNLTLLSTSVESMLAASPKLGDDWRDSLTLLAMAWLEESKLAYRLDHSGSRGPVMRYDNFGNAYFMDDSQVMQMQGARQNQPQAIPVAELLEYRPSDQWLSRLDESLQPRFHELLANLFLKVQEEDNAFPYIAQLAESQPEIAKRLVNECLTVWANNHDPNQGRRMQSPIFRIYGFSQRAEGIPLTRSKQERNLRELSELLTKLRTLPVADQIDEELLVRAFTVCHSSAEVYDLESIRAVFGDVEAMAPATIAGLAQQMRSNLAGLWRQPDVQKQNNTNRRKKDIEAEVLRGYAIANQVTQDALSRHAGNWALLLAKAAIMHDEVNYRHEVAKSSKFTELRLAALAEFRKAAEAYAAQLSGPSEDETAEVYEMWFHASLGACDLRQLDADKMPILSQPPLIRDAMNALPPAAADRHMAKFANSLFTKLRSVGPAAKFRYLKNGFVIVGDHEQALDAKKVFDYYDDLVTEIELHAVVDGTTNVGHEQPFGIFVNLRHTREIERESGGFGRYLQNQNNVRYAYNYGRPTENYRDKFEEGVRTALGEHFEVLSVTFQTEDVTSKADAQYGWRTTPYAYLLVKARGAEVDRIPPIKLDLDFLESSGYVVLPIESPMVPIDAGANADQRPVEILSVVQTLDERQANEGKLILEVKATAHGLIPEFDEIVKLENDAFKVATIDDEGVSVSRFDPESDDTAIVAERLWNVTLTGRTDLEELPDQFTFGDVKVGAKENLFQRYADADLEMVSQTVDLGASYGAEDSRMLWTIVGIVGAVLAGLVGWLAWRSKHEVDDPDSIHLPQEITPFSVIGVLREIHRDSPLSPHQRQRLEQDIHRLEGAYFSPEANEDADLQTVVESWLKQARV